MPKQDTVKEPARWDDDRLRWDMPGLFYDGFVPDSVRNQKTTMAESNTKMMSPAMLQEDKDAVTAILAMAEYSSVKPEFEKSVMYQKAADKTESGLCIELEEAERDYLLKEQAMAEARDLKVALQWRQHDWVLGAREQLAARFGKSSDQYAASGLKKKTEYKKAGPKAGAAKKKPSA